MIKKILIFLIPSLLLSDIYSLSYEDGYEILDKTLNILSETSLNFSSQECNDSLYIAIYKNTPFEKHIDGTYKAKFLQYCQKRVYLLNTNRVSTH